MWASLSEHEQALYELPERIALRELAAAATASRVRRERLDMLPALARAATVLCELAVPDAAAVLDRCYDTIAEAPDYLTDRDVEFELMEHGFYADIAAAGDCGYYLQ